MVISGGVGIAPKFVMGNNRIISSSFYPALSSNCRHVKGNSRHIIGYLHLGQIVFFFGFLSVLLLLHQHRVVH